MALRSRRKLMTRRVSRQGAQGRALPRSVIVRARSLRLPLVSGLLRLHPTRSPRRPTQAPPPPPRPGLRWLTQAPRSRAAPIRAFLFPQAPLQRRPRPALLQPRPLLRPSRCRPVPLPRTRQPGAAPLQRTRLPGAPPLRRLPPTRRPPARPARRARAAAAAQSAAQAAPRPRPHPYPLLPCRPAPRGRVLPPPAQPPGAPSGAALGEPRRRLRLVLGLCDY